MEDTYHLSYKTTSSIMAIVHYISIWPSYPYINTLINTEKKSLGWVTIPPPKSLVHTHDNIDNSFKLSSFSAILKTICSSSIKIPLGKIVMMFLSIFAWGNGFETMESNSSLCLGLYDDEDGLEILEVYNDGVSVGPQGSSPHSTFSIFFIYIVLKIYI